MPQSIVKIFVHIVFSTKDRRPIIPAELEPRLFAYISGIIRNNKGRMIIAGGIADHIHLLVSIGRIDIGQLIGDIKRDSSKWMKENGIKGFYWQRGYGAFSIGQSPVGVSASTSQARRGIMRNKISRTSSEPCAASMT